MKTKPERGSNWIALKKLGVLALGIWPFFLPAQITSLAGRLDPSAFTLRSETLTSAECQAIYLKLIENFAGWAEAHWEENPVHEPGGGRFAASGAGVRWARGNSNLCIVYAVLLDAYPHRTHFTVKHIPRAQMEDHLRRTLRFLCLGYREDQTGKSDDVVMGPGWQISLDFIGAVWAAHLFESRLDAETIQLVRQTACAIANSLDKEIPSRRFGDTGSEDGAWNGPFLAFVANKYASDPRAGTWDERAKKWTYNTLSRGADARDETLMDGRPLKDWIVSENVHPDLTIENHDMWSTGYQIQCQFFLEGELAYRLFGRPVPQAFSFHADEMWNKVTRALYLWDGDMLLPTGQDWGWKAYIDMQYMSWMRNYHGHPEAAAYESRALQMIYKRQLAVGTGGFGTLNFGNNTAGAKRWCFSYLGHKYAEESPTATMEAAYEKSLGVYQFPFVKTLIHRAPEKVVTISYHDHLQPIYVLPEGNTTFENPPFFIPFDRYFGGATVTEKGAEPTNQTGFAATNGGWEKVDLIDLQTGANTLHAVYTRQHLSGVIQWVGIASLPNEATLIVTEFQASRPGTYRIENPLPFRADTIQGFPMNMDVRQGTHWVNWTNHLGFVSTAPLPPGLKEGVFAAAETQDYSVQAGERFGRLAVVVYARQRHQKTKSAANTLRFEPVAKGKVAVRMKSSGGIARVELPWGL